MDRLCELCLESEKHAPLGVFVTEMADFERGTDFDIEKNDR